MLTSLDDIRRYIDDRIDHHADEIVADDALWLRPIASASLVDRARYRALGDAAERFGRYALSEALQ